MILAYEAPRRPVLYSSTHFAKGGISVGLGNSQVAWELPSIHVSLELPCSLLVCSNSDILEN